jgi:hypothetical protein
VGFSGVPGAAHISVRELKLVEQFHGAIRNSSSRTASMAMETCLASGEFSVSEATVVRVPIACKARLATSIIVVMCWDPGLVSGRRVTQTYTSPVSAD